MHLFVAKYEDGTTKILSNLADCQGEPFIEGHWVEQEKTRLVAPQATTGTTTGGCPCDVVITGTG